MTIHVNSRSDFVFAQMNAAYCIGEQNKKDTSTFPHFLVEMGLQDEMLHTHLACRHFSSPHKLKICGDPADMEKSCVD